jgi:hypothetical protein
MTVLKYKPISLVKSVRTTSARSVIAASGWPGAIAQEVEIKPD